MLTHIPIIFQELTFGEEIFLIGKAKEIEGIPIVFQELAFDEEIFLIGKARRLKIALESYRNRAQGQSEKDRAQKSILGI